jgi:hypothetical protein
LGDSTAQFEAISDLARLVQGHQLAHPAADQNVTIVVQRQAAENEVAGAIRPQLRAGAGIDRIQLLFFLCADNMDAVVRAQERAQVKRPF